MSNNQCDWDEYVQLLTYAYDIGVHYSTRATPFQLLLLQTSSDPAIYDDVEKSRKKAWKGRLDWVMRMASTVAPAKIGPVRLK